MLSDYLAMRTEDPDFAPAYPVVAAGMRGVEGIEPDVYITDPATGGCSDLFNAVYELLLQMIARYFAFGHETPEQRKVLAHAAVGLMFQAIRPLGFLLARLPVVPDHPDVTAGANFQLPLPCQLSAPAPPLGLAALRGAPRGAGPLRHWPPAAGGRRCDRDGVWRAQPHRLEPDESRRSSVIAAPARLAPPSRGGAFAEGPKESWFADTAGVGT
jgi:hypothetical protein